MDTDIKEGPTTPGVQFRWCRSVSCQTKEVYLILTSITGGQVNLVWKDDLGWYESDIVSLPCGLHSGFLLLREKVPPSFLKPDSSLQVDERDYKIDPFFISPHKFAVELFLQSSRSTGLWRENPYLRDRYLSFHNFDIGFDGSKGEDQIVSPRKSSSCQELRKLDYGSEDVVFNRETKTEIVKSKEPKQATGGSSGDLTICSKEGPDQFHGTNLKKWKSLGAEKSSNSKEDTSLNSSHSRFRSFQIGENKSHELFPTVHPGLKLSRSDGDAVSQYIKGSKTLLLHADLQQLKLDLLARTQGVESLLKHSDDEAEVEAQRTAVQHNLYFKEINPPTNEGYGCLITFESRSTSMDDLGSPRALEDVLVSLTSTDTESKHYHSLADTKDKEFVTKEPEKDTILREKQDSPLNRFLESYTGISTRSRHEEEEEEEENSPDPSTSERNCSRYPESDITIHEDENFLYDSLKNDDHKIPLNIKDVLDSEDSGDFYSVDPRSRVSDHQTFDLHLKSDQLEKFDVNNDIRISNKKFERLEDSDYDEKTNVITGSYNFENRRYPTSAQGEVATDPFVLVHPGSLRSETENGITESIFTESRKSLEKLSRKNSSFVTTAQRSKGAKDKDGERRTIVIIKDKRQPKMNTTGTQTSSRTLPSKHTQSVTSRSLTTLAHKYKENINYSPLPNKVSGPWSTKHNGDKVASNNYPYSENSTIKKLQTDLYNITKADKILKKIHPFDYRPTLVHKYKLNQNTNNENHQTPLVADVDGNQPRSSSSISNSIKSRVHLSRPNLQSTDLKKSKTAKNIAFKSYSNTSSISSTSSGNQNPSRSIYSTHRIPLPNPIYQNYIQQSYSAPKRVKIVPKPYFSIYGRDAADISEEYQFHKSQLDAKNVQFKSSTSFRNFSSPIRPTKSLPDLRLERERSPYVYRRFPERSSRTYSNPPVYKQSFEPRRTGDSNAFQSFSGARRRRSFEERYPWSGSSGESTDSLIEEAENVAFNLRTYYPKSEFFRRGDSFSRGPRKEFNSYRRRTISSTDNITDIVPFRSSGATSPYVSESPFIGALRARSETDLRMVGKLSGGNQGEPPYLPYRNEHLSIGQIVKVLVPGEGVALARIVYNPVRESSSLLSAYSGNKNITVVLLSEPTSLAGNVITIPLNKILLAWPKV